MTTVQMHYFIVAAEHLNFTMAAEQLYITQPALSRQIAAIEDEIGTKLFSRCNNVLSLTKAGRVLLHQLSGLYSDYQNVIKNVRDVAAGIEGHINIWTPPCPPPSAASFKTIPCVRSILPGMTLPPCSQG